MNARAKAIIPYAAVLAIAAFLYGNTASFAALGRPGQLGPDFWPKAVLVLLMVTCAIEIVRVALARTATAGAIARAKQPQDEEEAPRYPMLLGAGIVLTMLYVPGMQVLGFFLATVIYLAAFMVVGRYRRYGVVAVTSVVGSVAFVFVFMKIVYVSLPLGIGPFQSVSTALMTLLGIH
jgi:putative tricarboxylic transport membrane protein